ncbi:hypothetical protein [Neodiprion abietis nucleopolyhedrovirus]|uniref:Uncharacterized protein n=1 Tax=Neodiprion abietis nucleopolyhedrovirus TaxID=204507 RepID=Q0ZP17_9CBAC|nr:hypothetical protein [Neodiprion abietis nucleopolyhedrovirus]ABC74937.1 unknown [Neodiprion abietis nucleopolyhedrovirus]
MTIDMDHTFLHTYFETDTTGVDNDTATFINIWKSGIWSRLQDLDQKIVDKYIDYVNMLELTNYKIISKPFIANKLHIEQIVTYDVQSKLFVENSLQIENGTSIYCTNCYVENVSHLKTVTADLYLKFREKYAHQGGNFAHAAIYNGNFGYVFDIVLHDWKSENICNIDTYPKRLYLFGENVVEYFRSHLERLQNALRYKNFYSGIVLIPRSYRNVLRKKFHATTIHDFRSIVSKEIGASNSTILLTQRDYIFNIKTVPVTLQNYLTEYQSASSLHYVITQYGDNIESIKNTYFVDRITRNVIEIGKISLPVEMLPVHSYHVMLPAEFGIQIAGTTNAFINSTYGVCLLLSQQIFGSVAVLEFDEKFIVYHNTLRRYASTLIYHVVRDLYLVRFTTRSEMVVYILIRCSSPEVKTEPFVNFNSPMIKNTMIFFMRKYATNKLL